MRRLVDEQFSHSPDECVYTVGAVAGNLAVEIDRELSTVMGKYAVGIVLVVTLDLDVVDAFWCSMQRRYTPDYSTFVSGRGRCRPAHTECRFSP